jgi:hypothetical protein
VALIEVAGGQLVATGIIGTGDGEAIERVADDGIPLPNVRRAFRKRVPVVTSSRLGLAAASIIELVSVFVAA